MYMIYKYGINLLQHDNWFVLNNVLKVVTYILITFSSIFDAVINNTWSYMQLYFHYLALDCWYTFWASLTLFKAEIILYSFCVWIKQSRQV